GLRRARPTGGFGGLVRCGGKLARVALFPPLHPGGRRFKAPRLEGGGGQGVRASSFETPACGGLLRMRNPAPPPVVGGGKIRHKAGYQAAGPPRGIPCSLSKRTAPAFPRSGSAS